MKNLKKVLAMVLAFACTFSMFAGAKVFEDVPAGSDYSEAITMLSDLGVIQGKDDGKYHPEDTITRAEACAMIARLMTGDPNVSQYVGAQSFTDVAKGSWKDSAIGYCYINGIVIGVGNNKFEPDRAITDAEFITMVVRAMGYETADMKQNYPYSYMSNAQAIGLLDGTNMVASTDALRGEDAQVIYNALFTDYARGAKLVNTTHGTSVETYPTLAESVWGLTRAAAGTWKEKDDETATLEYCKAHTWVVLGADTANEGHILAYPISDSDGDLYAMGKGVEAVSFKYDGDASAVAGYQVELWGEGSHGEPEWNNKEGKYVYSDDWTIKAIKTVKGQTAYDYNASMADSKSDNGEIVLGEETLDLDAVAANASEATAKYAVDLYVANEYNETEIKKAEDVEEALNVRDGAQYKLMDWDSDGDIDWVVASQANYFKVETANSKRVTVVSMKTGTDDDFETETKSNSQTWKLDDTTDIDGVDYKFVTEEDLAEGDIVEVTYTVSSDDDAELVTATITKVEAETKSLDKVSTKGGLTLTFDDEEIAVAQNYEKGDVVVPANPAIYRDFNSEELGTDFALYMNRNGFIVYSDYATETANYAMVLDVANGSDVAGNRELAKVDLLLADDSVAKDVELTSGARVQDATGEDRDDIYSSRTFEKEEMVVGNVYKYWTNEDGQITRMQAMFNDASIEKDGGKDTDRVDNDAYSYKSSTDRLQDSKKNYVASLEESDVIFAVKVADNDSYIKDGGEDRGLYVNSSDVKAVKYDQIPDINMDANDADETDVAALDDRTTRTANWLQNDANAYDGTFVVSADGNKAGSAALLGVDNFNKFAAGNTKIGLVTDISYTNSSDGKYVEVEVATNGKYETIESKKKVDFDDIVEVLDNDGADPVIKNESTSVQTGVFYALDAKGAKVAVDLDKYLEDNAAYAEITTDADGNVTKVTFLDTEDGAAETNELVGNYYNVTRTVVTENKSKSFDYINTLGDAQAIQYASKDELYSVDRMPEENSAVAEDAVYYTIDSTPTRMDGQYKNKEALTVSAGFDGTPDIEVADKAAMLTASIDNQYTSDTYYVADIAFKGDEIVAMFHFDEDMGEKAGLSGNATLDDATIAAGAKAEMTVADLDSVKNLDTDKLRVDVLNKDNKVVIDDQAVTVKNGKFTVDTSALAAGDYTVALYGYNTEDTEYQLVDTAKLTVLAEDVVSGSVSALKAMNADGEELMGSTAVAENGAVYFQPQDKNGNAVDMDASQLKVMKNGAVDTAYTITRDGDSYKVTTTGGVQAGTLNIAIGNSKTLTLTVGAPSVTAEDATVDYLIGEVEVDVTVEGYTVDEAKALPIAVKNSGTDKEFTATWNADASKITLAPTAGGKFAITRSYDLFVGDVDTTADITVEAATFTIKGVAVSAGNKEVNVTLDQALTAAQAGVLQSLMSGKTSDIDVVRDKASFAPDTQHPTSVAVAAGDNGVITLTFSSALNDPDYTKITQVLFDAQDRYSAIDSEAINVALN